MQQTISTVAVNSHPPSYFYQPINARHALARLTVKKDATVITVEQIRWVFDDN